LFLKKNVTYPKNKTNILGRCFGNSQAITLSENIDYFEGFMKCNDNFILHGFNVYNNEVIDYTVNSNKCKFKDRDGNLPSEYYGIKINKNIIIKYNKDLIKEKSLNIRPLLKKLFELESLK